MSILIRGGLVLADADAEPTRADVLVEGDRIARVGTNLEPGPNDALIDGRERLVIPGLVNAHTHAHNHLAKGALDRLPLELWVQYLAARVLNRSPREIYVGAAIGAVEMAKSGTTCACEMAQVLPWPTDEALDAVAQAYLDVGLRASMAAQIADLPFYEAFIGLAERLPAELRAEIEARPAFPRAETLAVVRRAIDRWHGAASGRLRFGLGPLIATLCSTELLEACGELARERDLVLQTHLAETKVEAHTAQVRYGRSFTAQLRELGLLGPRSVLAHGVWLDERDLELIAESGATVVHNPISNLKLGAGIAPILAMRERGCHVALGTDGSASSDNLNLFGVLRLAAILPRVADPLYDRWPEARDVFRMATLEGARAAGFDGQIGAIAPGMKADLALLDMSATAYHPLNDLVNQLVYCEVGSSVRTVLVGGRVIVEDGRMTTVDEQALLAEADEIGRRVATEMGGPASFVDRVLPSLREAYLEVSRLDWPINRYA